MKERGRSLSQPPGAAARSGNAASARSRAFSLACLLAALGLQLAHSLPRRDGPYVDGRLHVVWENARFLLSAHHSNTAPPDAATRSAPQWLRVFGTAHYDYRPDGSAAQLSYYSHHPLLVPALFRAWTSVLGYAPRAARSFALTFSLATTALLFALLWGALGGSHWAGILTLLYVALPLPYQYVDVWKYETPANLVLLLALASLPAAAGSRAARGVFLGALALLGQADWNLYFALPVLFWPLWRARAVPAALRLWRAALAVALGSVLVNFGLLYALGFDLARAGSQGAFRISGGLHGVAGWLHWAEVQLAFLRTNLGVCGLGVAALGLLALADRRLRRPNSLLHGALCCAVSGLLWISCFRNLSLIHHFVQWSFATGLVLLLGGLLQNAAKEIFPGRPRLPVGLALAAGALLFGVWREAEALERRTLASAFGARADIAALEQLDCQRLLIGTEGLSGPPGWWETPVVAAALDPIWRGRASRACALQRLDLARELRRGDWIAVARAGAGAQQLQRILGERFPAASIGERVQTPNFELLGIAAAPAAR